MNKKIITATLLISDGPVEHNYFIELLDISNKDLVELLQEINEDMIKVELGFEITSVPIVTIHKLSGM